NCTTCTAGTFAASAGATSCMTCPAGTTSSAGASSCTTAPVDAGEDAAPAMDDLATPPDLAQPADLAGGKGDDGCGCVVGRPFQRVPLPALLLIGFVVLALARRRRAGR